MSRRSFTAAGPWPFAEFAAGAFAMRLTTANDAAAGDATVRAQHNPYARSTTLHQEMEKLAAVSSPTIAANVTSATTPSTSVVVPRDTHLDAVAALLLLSMRHPVHMLHYINAPFTFQGSRRILEGRFQLDLTVRRRRLAPTLRRPTPRPPRQLTHCTSF